MNMGEEMYLSDNGFISFEYIPRNRIAGSEGSSVLMLKLGKTGFWAGLEVALYARRPPWFFP